MEPSQDREPEPRLEIGEGNMEVTLIVRGRYPPALGYESVMNLLDEYGINYGTDTESVKKLLLEFEANESEDGKYETIVARGLPPEKNSDGRIEYAVKESPPVAFDRTGKADYRNIDKYISVKKGQLLARHIPPVFGKSGIDVYSHEVPPVGTTKDPKLKIGVNVEKVAGTNEIIARCQGVFQRKGNYINVSPILEIPGNVGLETGNIAYEGNLNIKGNIERGSSVHATGDIEVAGIVESGEIMAGGSLIAHQGINTRQEGMLEVEGNLSAVYIENSSILARGSIVVTRSIIQCTLITYADINVSGDNSAISGGEIIAFGSISTSILGNKNEARTIIKIGCHYENTKAYKTILTELESINGRYKKQAEEVVQIKAYIEQMKGRISAEKKNTFRVIFEAYKEILQLKRSTESKLKEFHRTRHNEKEVCIIARETVYPGVEIHCRGGVEQFKTARSGVTIRFTSGSANPVIEPYIKS